MRNPASASDDLDYVIVTTRDRVWMARAFAIVVVRLAKLRGVIVCPNYVLAESALAQTRRDLYIAHEVAQMIPLFGQPVYHAMRDQNPWVARHLPNAHAPFYAESAYHVSGAWKPLKQFVEWVFGSRLGDALERWEYRRKLKRFALELSTPNHAAQLDAQRVKGHFNNHGHPLLLRYEQCLQEYNLVAFSGD
jgi:hypothetical protein